MKIVAVVVTYNRLELLKENRHALQQQHLGALPSGVSLELLVVDNHSTDGTGAWLREVCGETGSTAGEGLAMSALFLEENLGGAGGFYYGMQYAIQEMGSDALWIMDDDTIPEADALGRLAGAYLSLRSCGKSLGFLASTVLWKDGSTCKMNEPKPLSGRAGQSLYLDGGQRLLPICQATFVSLLLSREVVEAVGLPRREYFIWGDDKEYTLRISDRYPCYQVGESRVVHKTANNQGSSVARDDIGRIGRYFYAYRNDYVTARERSKKEIIIYYLAFWLNELRILVYAGDKKKRLSVMREGRAAGKRLCEQKTLS